MDKKIRDQSDDNFIDNVDDFQDQDTQAYRLTNVSRDLQETLKDQKVSKELGLYSDPENYMPNCFD